MLMAFKKFLMYATLKKKTGSQQATVHQLKAEMAR
jgi:hypothetical protein